MYAEHNTGEKELYDLTNDPFELRSRHNDPAYASVRAQLAASLTSCRTAPVPAAAAIPRQHIFHAIKAFGRGAFSRRAWRGRTQAATDAAPSRRRRERHG